MAWNKSGAERVKSYRVYQDLERQYHDALEEITSLRTAINVKDELIRRLAAEIANIPRTPTTGQVEALHEHAADAYARNVTAPKERPHSGVRTLVRPGAYSSVRPFVLD